MFSELEHPILAHCGGFAYSETLWAFHLQGDSLWLEHPDRRFAGVGLDLVGTDISKLAVKLAAKKYAMPAGAMRFAVALSNRLPFPDGSLDCVVSVLAPVPAK